MRKFFANILCIAKLKGLKKSLGAVPGRPCHRLVIALAWAVVPSLGVLHSTLFFFLRY